MGYGRLHPPGTSQEHVAGDDQAAIPTGTGKRKKIIIISIFSFALIIASGICAAFLIISFRSGTGTTTISRKPTQAIAKTCSKTRFPNLCIQSLLDFPGAESANEQDLVHISFNLTMQHFSKALYQSSIVSYQTMSPRVRSAYDDCLELMEDSVDALGSSLFSIVPESDGNGNGNNNNYKVGSMDDVVTWLSAALTNQDTCSEGFADVSDPVKDQTAEKMKDLTELVSNSLSMYVAAGGDDFGGVPIQNKRRLLLSENDIHEFPAWLGRRERELLSTPVSAIQADIIVSKDGSGTVKTIAEAIKKAPEKSNRRIIIYVRAGRYEEDTLKVGRKKTNLMFIGDGKGKTVITGGKSVSSDMTTFHTSSFAATGAGFIARDITFENYAGPAKHQAVALRVGADHAAIYRCSIIGYQDTLYVHSNRQFYRECDIYGTVDFIFGNAAVVLQNCNIYARKPMAQQKNTITAQNRKDPNQNTGISIHACRILPTPDLAASKGSFSTYLGRPWKLYSRTVYMLSYMENHIHPRGWLEWNATFALDTLYYGEYMNSGPGAAVGQRVKWPGYRVITSEVEASKFTVAKFIYGSSWLPSTGVAFLGGLQQ